MAKWFTVHATAMTTEETIRALVRAGDAFTVSETANFKPTIDHVLKVTDLQRLTPLFDLVRLTRNTIHNNGVHRPASGRDESIAYGGRTFTFTVGEQLTWMGEDFIHGSQSSSVPRCWRSSRVTSSPRLSPAPDWRNRVRITLDSRTGHKHLRLSNPPARPFGTLR